MQNHLNAFNKEEYDDQFEWLIRSESNHCLSVIDS